MDQKPHDDLIRLLKLSRSLLSTRELDKLLGLVVRAFVQATEADRAFLLLVKEDGSLEAVAGEHQDGTPLQASERMSSLAEQVARDGVPVYSTNIDLDMKLGHRASINELGLHMVVCVPLKSQHGIVGVIYADGKTTLDTVFTSSNRSALEALADHAGAAIENARVFESAIRDPLTNLFNFGFFQVRLKEYCATQGSYYVAYIDIEDLVGIAARLGPQAADQTLRAVAEKLRTHLVVPEIAARVGASTLGVCLSERSAGTVETRLRALISDCANVQIEAMSEPITVRISVGAIKLDARLDHTLVALQGALKAAAERDPPLLLR